MNILISNDDGYFSEGIQQLKLGLRALGHKVFLVAPDRDNSASGMSITVRESLTARKINEDEYALSGTPVDCVHMALGGLIIEKIDIIVSGINNGANLCDDTLYSGTVAAAVEGRRLDNPNIAVSIPELKPAHYETAVHVVGELLSKIDSLPNKQEITLLNVNVPDLPVDELKGMKVTSLGKRLRSELPRIETGSKGEIKCWVGAVGVFDDDSSSGDSDYHIVQSGYASVTPVKAEWLHKVFVEDCADWLD